MQNILIMRTSLKLLNAEGDIKAVFSKQDINLQLKRTSKEKS